MEYKNLIELHINQQNSLLEEIKENLMPNIETASKLIAKTLKKESTIFWCGNGGSAADSQHLAAELVGRFEKERKPLRSVALTTDSSILTCISNDYCYEEIFARQLEALSKEGDLIVALTTSGKSKNIIKVLERANSLKIKSILLTGRNGIILNHLVDESIIVPSSQTTHIQESHIMIGHIICKIIEKELGYA